MQKFYTGQSSAPLSKRSTIWSQCWGIQGVHGEHPGLLCRWSGAHLHHAEADWWYHCCHCGGQLDCDCRTSGCGKHHIFFKFHLTWWVLVLTVFPPLFSSSSHGDRGPSTVKRRLVFISVWSKLCGYLTIESKLLYSNTFHFVLAAQRNGDHVLKLLITSLMYPSLRLGCAPCWSLDQLYFFCLSHFHVRETKCLLRGVQFLFLNATFLLFNEGSFSIGSTF